MTRELKAIEFQSKIGPQKTVVVIAPIIAFVITAIIFTNMETSRGAANPFYHDNIAGLVMVLAGAIISLVLFSLFRTITPISVVVGVDHYSFTYRNGKTVTVDYDHVTKIIIIEDRGLIKSDGGRANVRYLDENGKGRIHSINGTIAQSIADHKASSDELTSSAGLRTEERSGDR